MAYAEKKYHGHQMLSPSILKGSELELERKLELWVESYPRFFDLHRSILHSRVHIV